MNPILLVGFERIIGFTILSVVFLPFNYSCPFKTGSVCRGEYFENLTKKISNIFESPKSFFGHLFVIFGLFSFNLFRILTVFYYSPKHKTMANSGRLVLFWIL